MDIRFKVNNVNYQIRNSTYDFVLNEIISEKEDKKTGEMKLSVKARGGYSNPYNCVRAIPNYQLLDDETSKEIESFMELEEMVKQLYAEIREIVIKYDMRP